MKCRFYSLFLLLFLPLIAHSQPFPYQDSTLSVNERVADLISRMSTDEKIGQMMQADLSAVSGDKSVITSYRMGSILSGGGSDPVNNLPLAWRQMHDDLQGYAMDAPLKIPLIYGVDAVHGHSNVDGATIFPHNIGLGCTRNLELVEEIARITAIEVLATGIPWTFAPAISVVRDERWGRSYEGFGETAELAELGAVQVRGFQGDSLLGRSSVLATPKHFLGDGGTFSGTDQGNTIADEATVRALHLPGYIKAIEYGAQSIMPSYSSINGQKMHGFGFWLNDVLKSELEFEGFLISDWAGVDQVNGNYKEAVRQSINAGVDMVMLPNRYDDFRTVMRELIAEQSLSMERINDAVSRILTVKFKLGLFEKPYADQNLLNTVGSPEHRAVARQAVRESMVLLQKKDHVLPLPKSESRILVAGRHADNLGFQCGGWTIDWQGFNSTNEEKTSGTTILEGLREVAPSATIEFNIDGNFQNTNADYSIVVIGEEPYAEGAGDKGDLSMPAADINLIRKMKDLGHPVIVILVTGRPMILNEIQHYADVLVAAWLPGTEGNGIADVLFGDYQPSGLLSHTWPRTMEQVPINFGDENYDPLYAYGYGITSLSNSEAGSAPVLLSALATGDGNSIELSFNKAMNSPSLSGGEFILSRNGNAFNTTVSAALKESDSTVIILTLGEPVVEQDELTISYTPGSLESSDNGLLAAFSAFDVYNNAAQGAFQVPGRIEAENYTAMSGVQTEPSQDVDGGLNVGFIETGDWMEYLINVPVAGDYRVDARTASLESGGEIAFISGNDFFGSMALPVTGWWFNWETATDTLSLPAGEYTLRLTAWEGGFNINWFSFTAVSTGIDDNTNPSGFRLSQNYPNPFNPSTTISYFIPNRSQVSITVYDVFGRELEVLVDKVHQPGSYDVSFDASELPSGIYFYRMDAGSFSETKKLTLLK